MNENLRFDISLFGMDINGACDGHFQLRLGIVICCWLFMIIAVIIDFMSGIRKSKALNIELRSSGYRSSLNKLKDYWSVALFALMFDILAGLFPFWKYPLFSVMACVVILCIEAKSVIENSQATKSGAGKIPATAKQLLKVLTSSEKTELIKEILEKLSETETKEKI